MSKTEDDLQIRCLSKKADSGFFAQTSFNDIEVLYDFMLLPRVIVGSESEMNFEEVRFDRRVKIMPTAEERIIIRPFELFLQGSVLRR
jgi:hypothetical protein